MLMVVQTALRGFESCLTVVEMVVVLDSVFFLVVVADVVVPLDAGQGVVDRRSRAQGVDFLLRSVFLPTGQRGVEKLFRLLERCN